MRKNLKNFSRIKKKHIKMGKQYQRNDTFYLEIECIHGLRTVKNKRYRKKHL